MDKKHILDVATAWTKEPFDTDTISKTKLLIDSGSDEYLESFYKNLEFL